jgi:hypothetical protein
MGGTRDPGDIVAAARAHIASLPTHLKDRYSAKLICKLIAKVLLLEELREQDGKVISILVEQGQRMRDRMVNGDQSYARSDDASGVSNTISLTDAVPEAKAKSCEKSLPQAASELGNPVRHSTQDGTGNTGESLCDSLPDYCWAGDTDGGAEMRIADECRDPDLLAAEVRRLKTVIAAGEPTLTPAEREAIEWAAIRSDADAQMIGGEFYAAGQSMRARSATLRALLERLT